MTCRRCGTDMVVETEIRDNNAEVDIFVCQNASCVARVAVIWEPEGGYTEAQQTWIEREIARHGAFFPTDYTGRDRLRR